MEQKTGNAYANLQQNSFYKYIKHKKIHLEYPFSNNKDIEKPFLIRELAEQWALDIKSILRPSTYACYQKNIEKYILPYIGEMPASLFNADILSDILIFLKQKNNAKSLKKNETLSQYTLYLLENIVHAMFRFGAEKGFIPEISFGKPEYKIKNKKEAMPLSELETYQLISAVYKQEQDVQLQILLPLYTGINLSELCGLKWEDADLESGKIHIHRNLVRIQQKTGDLIDNNKSYGIFDAKSKNSQINKKNREISPSTILAECELPQNECREFIIPEKLYDLLKVINEKKKPSKESYIAEVNKKAGRTKKAVTEKVILQNEINLNTTVPIMKSCINYPPPDSRTLQYRLKNVGETAWIDDLNYQRLRDTFAVMCLQAGGDVYSVAYVMGIGTGTVCDRYKQWLVKDDRFLKGIG